MKIFTRVQVVKMKTFVKFVRKSEETPGTQNLIIVRNFITGSNHKFLIKILYTARLERVPRGFLTSKNYPKTPDQVMANSVTQNRGSSTPSLIKTATTEQ